MAGITLVTFFVTLGLTGDKATAFVAVVIVTFVAATFTAAAIVVVAFAAAAEEVLGVGKKVVWCSYMGEFLLILLPMLWVLR